MIFLYRNKSDLAEIKQLLFKCIKCVIARIRNWESIHYFQTCFVMFRTNICISDYAINSCHAICVYDRHENIIKNLIINFQMQPTLCTKIWFYILLEEIHLKQMPVFSKNVSKRFQFRSDLCKIEYDIKTEGNAIWIQSNIN